MKVTHVNSYFFTNRLHEELVLKLVRKDIEQHVFVALPSSSLKKSKDLPPVSFSLDNCFSKFERIVWPLKMWRIWRSFKLDKNETASDMNHAHTLFVNGLIAFWAKKKYGTPYVVTIRNTDVNQFLKKLPFIFRPIAVRVISEAEYVTTLSHVYWDKHMRSHLSEYQFQGFSKKHITIPNGCEDFWFIKNREYRSSGACLKLVFVGLLDDNKNCGAVLDACKRLQDKGVEYELAVVGSGPLERALKSKAEGLVVHFHGYLEDRCKLQEIYRKSDILVVPSRTETFGVVYAEALTQGLPVIYTSGQGFDGFFPDGIVGFAVDPDDSQQIADRVIDIGNDYSQFSQRALDRSEEFKWGSSVDRLTDIYRNTVKSVKNTQPIVD